MKELVKLRRMYACSEALAWLDTQPDWPTAWNTCQRGDWMLWLISKQSGKSNDERRLLVLTACECARLSLPFIPEEETRPRLAIEAAERWAKGDNHITLDIIRGAATAAYAAAAYAAAATACAAYAAAASADAAVYATYAADAAVYAADACAAYTETLTICANIVRKHYPIYTLT